MSSLFVEEKFKPKPPTDWRYVAFGTKAPAPPPPKPIPNEEKEFMVDGELVKVFGETVFGETALFPKDYQFLPSTKKVPISDSFPGPPNPRQALHSGGNEEGKGHATRARRNGVCQVRAVLGLLLAVLRGSFGIQHRPRRRFHHDHIFDVPRGGALQFPKGVRERVEAEVLGVGPRRPHW